MNALQVLQLLIDAIETRPDRGEEEDYSVERSLSDVHKDLCSARETMTLEHVGWVFEELHVDGSGELLKEGVRAELPQVTRSVFITEEYDFDQGGDAFMVWFKTGVGELLCGTYVHDGGKSRDEALAGATRCAVEVCNEFNLIDKNIEVKGKQ